MARRKVYRLEESKKLENVYDETAAQLKGCWAQQLFGNNYPIVLELGCGKGEFSIEMATRYPERNFIGIDYKGYVLWKAGTVALEIGLKNIAFLRIDIRTIVDYFVQGEVDEIWFIFPDPFPKNRHEKHRLFYPDFLPLYHYILKEKGHVHLKTDSQPFYDYAKNVLSANHIHPEIALHYHDIGGEQDYHIATTFERKFLKSAGHINYLRFTYPQDWNITIENIESGTCNPA